MDGSVIADALTLEHEHRHHEERRQRPRGTCDAGDDLAEQPALS
ncbi:MAG: hypothetical protein R3F05_09695 [Planctomycetota bacterium]